VKQEEERN